MKPIFATIASFNKLATIKQLIKSIFNTGAMEFIELNIVDDCSSDPNVRVWLKELKKEHSEINIYLLNEWILGVTPALNLGLSKKHPDQIFVSMDNDGIFTQSGWCEKLINLYEQNPEVGMVAIRPPIIDSNNEHFPHHETLPIEITPWLPNLCTSIRPEALEEVGAYFPFPFTCFDYDMGLRVTKAGYLTGYFDSSRTTRNGDYIDMLDLGRPIYFDTDIEIDKECVAVNYNNDNMKEILEKATLDSMIMFEQRKPEILAGSIYVENNMQNYNNYEEL